MSEEVKEKVGFFKRTWKYLVTGATCAVVGAGITIGADPNILQETVAKAQARQAVVAAAQYSAETAVATFVEKAGIVISTDKSKIEAIKVAAEAGKEAGEKVIEAAKTTVTEAKEAVQEAVKDVKDAKAAEEAKDGEKKEEAKTTEVKTEAKVEATKATTEVKAEAAK